jgi:hypothetical protein
MKEIKKEEVEVQGTESKRKNYQNDKIWEDLWAEATFYTDVVMPAHMKTKNKYIRSATMPSTRVDRKVYFEQDRPDYWSEDKIYERSRGLK